MHKASIVIVSPALADANNGNWQTARRWQSMLAERYRVRICRDWSGSGHDSEDAAMIALHARRSAASIQAWAQQHPGRGLAVVLTGTDLYRDIAQDAQARQSRMTASAGSAQTGSSAAPTWSISRPGWSRSSRAACQTVCGAFSSRR